MIQSTTPEPVTPQTRITKVTNYLVLIALAILGITIFVYLRWAFESEDILKINNAPFPTRSIREHPTAAGVIILETDYCKNKDIQGRLRVSFVSATREIFLPVSQENAPKTCHKTDVPILLPKDLPPDTYKVKFRATYDINPLKKQVPVEFESREFEVVE